MKQEVVRRESKIIVIIQNVCGDWRGRYLDISI